MLQFKLVIGIVGVKALIIIDIVLVEGHADFSAFFDLFLCKLLVKPLLFDLFLHLGGEGAPGEFDRDGAFVNNLKVLVGEQRD